MNNELRVLRVQACLSDHYEEDTLVDLLADAMHFCKENKVSFNHVLQTAETHFDAEQEENE